MKEHDFRNVGTVAEGGSRTEQAVRFPPRRFFVGIHVLAIRHYRRRFPGVFCRLPACAARLFLLWN